MSIVSFIHNFGAASPFVESIKMRPLLQLSLLIASASALAVTRNVNDTLTAYERREPRCDSRTSGRGIDFGLCYRLVLHDMDADGKVYQWWKYRGGHTEPGFRHLPYPTSPWGNGEVQAQLDMPHDNGVTTIDDFSLSDVRSHALDLMNKCCRQKMGGTVMVGGAGLVQLRIGRIHSQVPWLQLPGGDDVAANETAVTAGSGPIGEEISLDPNRAIAGS